MSDNVEQQWSIYLIRTRLGHLYCGISTDVARRFQEHCSSAKGARYLRGKGPLQLVYQRYVGSHSQALREEYRIKRMKKLDKERLIHTGITRMNAEIQR